MLAFNIDDDSKPRVNNFKRGVLEVKGKVWQKLNYENQNFITSPSHQRKVNFNFAFIQNTYYQESVNEVRSELRRFEID